MQVALTAFASYACQRACVGMDAIRQKTSTAFRTARGCLFWLNHIRFPIGIFLITGGVLQTTTGFVTYFQSRRFINTTKSFGLFWSCECFENTKEEVTLWFGSVLHIQVEIKRQNSAITTRTDITDGYRWNWSLVTKDQLIQLTSMAVTRTGPAIICYRDRGICWNKNTLGEFLILCSFKRRMKIVAFGILVKGNTSIKGEGVRKQRRKGEKTTNTENKLQN